jgi:hypothetical protein
MRGLGVNQPPHTSSSGRHTLKQPDAATLETLITQDMTQQDWVTVNELEPRLDAVAQPKQPPPMVSAALYYAEQGLRVFPLQPKLKTPHRGSRGFKDATTDSDTIITWWYDVWPDSNIGIATGHLVDVIDIDGPEGVKSWARMDNLPEILGVVSTPRPGGNHLYIHATGRGNKAGIFPGVDHRGLGGYVVAPPSVNENGVRYTWRRPLELP